MTKPKYFIEVPKGTRHILNLLLFQGGLSFIVFEWEDFGRIFFLLIFCIHGIIELINGGIAYFVAYREVFGLFKAATAFTLGYIFYQWLIPEWIATL